MSRFEEKTSRPVHCLQAHFYPDLFSEGKGGAMMAGKVHSSKFSKASKAKESATKVHKDQAKNSATKVHSKKKHVRTYVSNGQFSIFLLEIREITG